jgi:hypothetical protein
MGQSNQRGLWAQWIGFVVLVHIPAHSRNNLRFVHEIFFLGPNLGRTEEDLFAFAPQPQPSILFPSKLVRLQMKPYEEKK